jgi:hypothetical protein
MEGLLSSLARLSEASADAVYTMISFARRSPDGRL